MANNPSLEERIAVLEQAFANLLVELKEQKENPQQIATSSLGTGFKEPDLNPPASQTTWLQQITGSFKDEPAFEEVLAYGRAIRQGDESILKSEDEE